MKTFLATAVLSGLLAGVTMFAADAPPTDYPLKKCVISGKSLGTMGKPFKVTSDGTDVYLCCKNCQEEFNKDPGKYLKMVRDAPKAK